MWVTFHEYLVVIDRQYHQMFQFSDVRHTTVGLKRKIEPDPKAEENTRAEAVTEAHTGIEEEA